MLFLDRPLIDAWWSRTAHDHGIDILIGAWAGVPPVHRAAMIAALGDVQRAGACGGEGWSQLAKQDIVGALRVARGAEDSGARNESMALLEAEALGAAGAIVASLTRLEGLLRQGSVPAAVSLARRRHMLGDHIGAQHVAATLPMHAHAALTGARAALVAGHTEAALRFIEPFLSGAAPIPEPAVAGTFAVVAASVLARALEFPRLKHFVSGLLAAPDLAEDMMPTTARAAWTAGLAEHAWNRFNNESNPWMNVARLELATLAGNAKLASQLLTRAGPLGIPAKAALLLLNGRDATADREAAQIFEGDGTLHVWRTHPHRWQPWIEAVSRTSANIEIYDLSRKEIPDEQAIPRGVLDDSSLIELMDPVPVDARPIKGSGVWIDKPLCRGVGIGHDWPEEETSSLTADLPLVSRRKAAVQIMGADAALAHAHEGRATVVVAPPGDPFWAGPFPELAWPAMHVIRADSRQGWTGAGERAAKAVKALCAGAS